MSTKKKISDIDKAIEEMQQRRDECFKHIGKAMYESCPELGDMSVADMRKAGRYATTVVLVRRSTKTSLFSLRMMSMCYIQSLI